MAVYTPIDYVIALGILFAVLWLSKYLFTRVPLDEYFVLAIAPTMALAITIRLLADAGVYQKSQYWSVTPGVYILGAAFGVVAIAIGLFAEGKWKVDYWKITFILGAVATLYFLARLTQHILYPTRSLYPLVLAIVITSLIYALSSLNKTTNIFTTRTNLAIIFAHLLDASGTFIGMDYYGFYEEHPLPELIINFFGSAAIMIPLKLVVILGALYYLETRREEGAEAVLYYKMIKFVFFILGIGPGTRNAVILTLG
ncbi:MAG: DUF63 family protein [Candidatus Hydrothermarchaeales archaeon]